MELGMETFSVQTSNSEFLKSLDTSQIIWTSLEVLTLSE